MNERINVMGARTENKFYCLNCKKYFHAYGMPSHRKAHLRRGEIVRLKDWGGTRETYYPKSPGDPMEDVNLFDEKEN